MKWQFPFDKLRAGLMVALLLGLAGAPAAAQRWIAPGTALTGSGDFMVGYTGGNGGLASSHSLFLGLNGTFQGFWQDPRILNFSISPNWRWDRANSSEAGTSDGNEGVVINGQFLSSSSMPLSVSYNLTRLTDATLSGGLTPIQVQSAGLSQNVTLNWCFQRHTEGRRRMWPTLSLGFSKGVSHNSVYGITSGELSNDNLSYSAQSTYQILKFHITAGYLHQEINQSTPDLLQLGTLTKAATRSQSESVGIGRSLGKKSSFGLSYSRSASNVSILTAPSEQKYETATAQVTSNPFTRFTVNANANYVSNVSAQTLVNLLGDVGTAVPGRSTAGGSPQFLLSTGRQLDASENANYLVTSRLQLFGGATQMNSDLVGGLKVDNSSYSAGVIYTRPVAKGFLSASYAPGYYLVDERIVDDQFTFRTDLHGLINTAAAHYTRRFGRWQGQGGFTFSQSNMEGSAIVPLVSRTMNANLTATTRLLHQWNFTANYAMSKTDLAGANGSLSHSISGSVSNRTWSFMGQAQFTNGYSVLTAFGLVPVGAGVPAGNLLQSFYNDSHGFSVSASYGRPRLRLSATYSRASSNVQTSVFPVLSGNSNLDGTVTYHFRRLDFRAGVRRWTADISSNNALRQSTITYYGSLVRQFHLF